LRDNGTAMTGTTGMTGING